MKGSFHVMSIWSIVNIASSLKKSSKTFLVFAIFAQHSTSLLRRCFIIKITYKRVARSVRTFYISSCNQTYFKSQFCKKNLFYEKRRFYELNLTNKPYVGWLIRKQKHFWKVYFSENILNGARTNCLSWIWNTLVLFRIWFCRGMIPTLRPDCI